MTAEREFRCTDVAWEFGIPLIGTATRGDIWFLIEYPGRWEAKAFEESDIPDPVKAHIGALSNPGNRVRTLLIRHPGEQHHEGFLFFAGHISPLESRLYEYHLEEYSEILDFNLEALADGEPGDPNHLRSESLYLVCTNGRRDRCCAIYGPEVYKAMTEEAGEAVWASSHIGGHNQAPITLFFPHGVNYGHTSPSEARRLIRAHKENKVVLHHYRGRVCFEPHIQAAEHFWREQTGILDLPGVQIDSVVELSGSSWIITVSDFDGNKTENIRVKYHESDFTIPITCTGEKMRTISSFHRIG
jgi:hypothetical protein